MTTLPIVLLDDFDSMSIPTQEVIVGTPLAVRRPHVRINLAKALNLPLSRVKKTLTKKVGEEVKAGEVLARKKTLLSKKQILSEVNGVLVAWDSVTGEVVIRLPKPIEEEYLRSPVEGKVAEVGEKKIILETEKDVYLALQALGEEATAEVVYVQRGNEEVDNPTNILYAVKSNLSKKILLVDQATREVIAKALALDVAGIVIAQVPESDLAHFTQKDITTPVLLVDDDTFQKVTLWNQKKLYLNAKTRTILFLHS